MLLLLLEEWYTSPDFYMLSMSTVPIPIGSISMQLYKMKSPIMLFVSFVFYTLISDCDGFLSHYVFNEFYFVSTISFKSVRYVKSNIMSWPSAAVSGEGSK